MSKTKGSTSQAKKVVGSVTTSDQREYTREELIRLMGLEAPFEWLANAEEDLYKRGDGTPIVWPKK